MDPAYAPYAYSPYIIKSLLQKNRSFLEAKTRLKVPPLEIRIIAKFRVPPGANVDFCSPSVDKTNERMISARRNMVELSLFSWIVRPGLADGFNLLVYLRG